MHEIYIALRANESRAQVDEYVQCIVLPCIIYVTNNLLQF